MPTEDLKGTNSKPIKILLITARADLGGGPRHVIDLIGAFPPNEIQFSIASPEQEPFAVQFREKCQNFIEIPTRRFSIAAFFRLHRFITSNDINIIHSHGRGAGLYSRFLGLTTKRPVLHTFHGIHVASGVMGRIKLLIDQLLAFLPFHGVFGSKPELERAQRYHVIREQPYSVIFNAVDLNRFPLSHLKAKGDLIRIGAFLRDDPVKGPDRWLKLVNMACEDSQFPKIEFTCAGITKDDLRKHGHIPGSMVVAGPLNDPIPWLSGLDIFVSTARAEGLPIGVLEAMAARLPCLLSNIPAHSLFTDNNVAIGFDPENVSDFLDKLTLLKSDETSNNLKTAARTWIEEDFSLNALKLRLAATYGDLNQFKTSSI